MSNYENAPVDKYGGTSTAWPQRLTESIQSFGETGRMVVVSAPGSDVVGDKPSRMTEMLKTYEKNPSEETFAPILPRLGEIARRGCLQEDYIRAFEQQVVADIEMARQRGEPLDPLGETWQAQMTAEMLGPGWQYVAAKDMLHFDSDGRLDERRSRLAVLALDPRFNYITDGNQGSGSDGRTIRIGDGGSDVSGAYLRKLRGPGTLRVHSDVDGYKTRDPNGANGAMIQEVPFVTYAEGQHMGKRGNGLIHANVSSILDGSGSTAALYSTRTGKSGTIMNDTRENIGSQPIVGITGERKVLRVKWEEQGSEEKAGTTIPFRQALADVEAPLHTTTTDDNSETVSSDYKYLDRLQKRFGDWSQVTIDDTLSFVTVVGEGMRRQHDPQLRAQVLFRSAMALDRYNIPLESATIDGIGATFFVPRRHFNAALGAIHDQIIAYN